MFDEKKKEPTTRLGRKIKKLRGKQGLTQKQLADLADVSESAMRSYELGDRNPKKEVLERTAKALRVRPEYLSSPEFGPRLEFTYALLENDDLMGYTVTEINECPAIVANDMSVGHSFYNFLKEWNMMREKLDAKEIAQEEYEDWKSTYEGATWVNTPDSKSPLTGE